MNWAKFDDEADDFEDSPPIRKIRKSSGRKGMRSDSVQDHREKRSSVRTHRNKTHKDQFLEENQ